jgi:hypothetical protein
LKYFLLLFFLTIAIHAQKINILDTKVLNLIGVNELSALAYDGKTLYALSNLSVLHHFKIELSNNKIKSIKLIKSMNLKTKKNKILKKNKSDSEGMVYANKQLYISFERKPRVNIYTLNGKKIKKYKIKKHLRDIKNYRAKNKALESIAFNNKYKLLVAPEVALKNEDKNYHTIYAKNNIYRFKASAKLTAMEFMNEDEILVLQREFSYVGFKRTIILSKVSLNKCKNNICKCTLLKKFQSNEELELDNYEGLTKVSKNKYLMVSDDNDSLLQKTILVYFEILP